MSDMGMKRKQAIIKMLVLVDELYILAKLLVLNTLNVQNKRHLEGDRGPAIFVGGTWGFWPIVDLRKYLEKNGVMAYFFDEALKEKDINEVTKRLKDFILENEINNPILVGHSLGGLVAVNYIKRYGDKGIKRVLCICSPFYGVRDFKLLNRFVNKQIVKDSKYLDKVREVKNTKKIVCVHGKWDQFMNIDSCILHGSVVEALNTSGHNRILRLCNMGPVYNRYID